MQKPGNYENTSDGSFTPIELGGHYMIIRKLEEMQSRSGKTMIKVMFDFAEPDKQPGYFMRSFQEDIRPDKKWPNTGTLYVLTEDDKGNCSRSFKRFITSCEKSNPGFTCQWGDNFGAQFRNKRIGGVFGIVEDEYEGKVKKRHQLRWVCAWDAVSTAAVPEEKLLKNDNKVEPEPNQNGTGWMNIPEGATDDGFPF